MMRAQLSPATINGESIRQHRHGGRPTWVGDELNRDGGVVIKIQPALNRRKRKLRDSSDSEDILKVKAFLDGDEASFEFLFRKYRRKVYQVAFRFVRNREDALDVTTDVFARVYQALEKFKTDSKFFTWLYRITVNRSIDYTRSNKNRPRPMDTSVMEAVGKPTVDKGASNQSPAEPVLKQEFHEELRQAVSTLSNKHQVIFILHAYEDLTYKEIAEVVGCNLGTVMSRLFYARKKLQELLGAMGYKPR